MSDASPSLDTLPCGVVSFTDHGIIVAINLPLADLVGSDPGDLIGRHVETLLTVGGRIFFQTHLYPILRLHGVANELFVLLRHRDGSDRAVLMNAVRRERDDGGALMDCVLMELRERRKFEDALLRARGEAEDANRAKSEFLANMSHELRTPLNAIAGYVQLMQLGIHGPVTAAQQEALARVARSQRLLLRLVNDVLNLARIESGRLEYRLESVALDTLVTSVLQMVEPQMAAGTLTASTDLTPGLVVLADREKLEQILLNLLTNAVKFTPGGGRITVVVEPDPDGLHALIRVRDTGIGIATARLAGVFEPFVRVEAGAVPRSEGTGLGLAISRDLAIGMGGELTVTSQPGHGSTFAVRLPLASARDGAAP